MDYDNRRDNLLPNRDDRFPQPGQDRNNPYVNPGFEVVDSGRTITPKQNRWQKGGEKADFDASVKRVTNWDADNFQGAYDAAAKSGGSVTFVVGSMDKPDTQATLKNLEALKAKNPNMQIVFLDTDKIASDPKYQGLRDWVQKSTNNDNLAFMAQYSVRPGEGGKPMGDKLVSTHWGSDVTSLEQQQQFGKMFTEKYKGQFKIAETQPENKPETKPQPGQDTKPAPPLTPQQAAIRDADSIDQKAVSTELDKVNAAIAEAAKAGEAGAKQLPELQAKQKQLQALRDAPARTRKEYAQKLFSDAAALNGKTDAASRAQAEGMTLEGYKQINAANERVPGYFNNDVGKQELKAMGFTDKAIESLNKTPATGAKSPYWLSENLYGQSEADKNKLYAENNEQKLKDTQREILEAALADAKAKNLPLVIKYGLAGCPPCIAMDKSAMADTAAALKDRAVVAAVDGPAAEEFLREHGYALQGGSYPMVEGFHVDPAGNLTRGTHATLESDALTNYDKNKGIDASPTKPAVQRLVDALHAERRQAAEAAAHRAAEQQKAMDLDWNRAFNLLLQRNPYQFTGDGDTPVRR